MAKDALLDQKLQLLAAEDQGSVQFSQPTFDVRGGKSFLTSCYVRKDIVMALGAGNSRNENRKEAMLTRNTLLQDSLNSVISSAILSSRKKKETLGRDHAAAPVFADVATPQMDPVVLD